MDSAKTWNTDLCTYQSTLWKLSESGSLGSVLLSEWEGGSKWLDGLQNVTVGWYDIGKATGIRWCRCLWVLGSCRYEMSKYWLTCGASLLMTGFLFAYASGARLALLIDCSHSRIWAQYNLIWVSHRYERNVLHQRYSSNRIEIVSARYAVAGPSMAWL